MMDIVIRNGTLITPASVFPADVGIVGERIAALGQELHGAIELDGTGCYVLPGAVDPHVHLQVPVGNYVSSDDFSSGTIAAALGGTTTVIDFVEPEPGEPLLEALAARRAEADGRVAVDYGLHMTIPTWHAALRQAHRHACHEYSQWKYSRWQGRLLRQVQDTAHPEPLDALPEVVAAGVPSFKLYLAYEGFRLDDTQLYRVMQAIAAAGGLPIIHCENGPICEALRIQAMAQGHTSHIYHALTRPPRQEAEAVSHAIDFAALAGSPLYVVHVSCEESMSRIQAARARGEDVYGETCPQYLLLNGMALDLLGGERLVCSPPLRTEEDNEVLWGGLAFGDLDVLATDHCPFTTAEKSGHPSTGSPPRLPREYSRSGAPPRVPPRVLVAGLAVVLAVAGHHADFTTIPGGLPSIEARLSLGLPVGRQHAMSLERWVEVCCANPARIFGLHRKGQIAPGFDADLVIFDPNRWVTIQAGKTLHERVDWSPYEGLRVQGWPRDVLSRGRVVVRDGEFVGEPGWGRFVFRKDSANGKHHSYREKEH